MKKEIIKPIVVLFSICLIVAVLLAAANYVTAPIIRTAEEEALQASLLAVLPDAGEFEAAELPADAPASVTGAYRDESGSGFAVSLSVTSSYSASPMTFTLGIAPDGTILGVEMMNYKETKDFKDYPDRYLGKDASLSGVDVYAGATYSSKAFRGGVEDAFAVLRTLGWIAS